MEAVHRAEASPPCAEKFRRRAFEVVRGGSNLSDIAMSLGIAEQALSGSLFNQRPEDGCSLRGEVTTLELGARLVADVGRGRLAGSRPARGPA